MARTAQEKTPAAKAAENARTVYQTAKEAHDKKATDQTKAKLDQARDALAVAVKAVNRERFLNVGNKRVKKARSAIRQVLNCLNPRTYNFTVEEAIKVYSGLVEPIKEIEMQVKKLQSGTTDKGTSSDTWSL